MKIVSANYLDRSSSDRWLIRDKEEPPREAQPVQSVHATGVMFCPSSDYERGFGCSIVAFCDTAVSQGEVEKPKKAVRLRFTGFVFIDAATGAPVEACKELFLNADGSMFAVLHSAPAKRGARKTAAATL